jgi:hypothetical protein
MALLVPAAAVSVAGAATRQAAQTRPVDRWLVATASAPDSLDRTLRLSTDLLAAPGEQGVLPDRGRPTAGVTWHLLRRDGEARVSLDSLLSEASPGTVVYAHAYLRLPADRTLRIDWGGTECTGTRAWLNGRELAGSPLSARFGGGWNTLLVKLVPGDCPLGLHVSLAAAGDAADRPDGGARARDWSVEDIRVQASRPPGDVRTGPEDWVVAADTARIADVPHWRRDRLFAGLVIGLTSWGRAAVTDVELELRNGPDGRATAPWLIPGSRGEAVVPVSFTDLDELLAVGAVDVRLRWDDEQVERRITVAGEKPGVESGVRLTGWEVKRTAGQAERTREAGRLPNGPGWILQGEWKVPGALAGRSLAIQLDDAPATYTLNGRAGRVEPGGVVLCAPCEEGSTLRLTATSTGPWTSMPRVRAEDVGVSSGSGQ